MQYPVSVQDVEIKMNETPDLGLDAIQMRSFEAKLGELATWKIPPISPTVGPFEPEAFDAFDRKRRELVDAVRDRLQTYSQDELVVIAEDTGKKMPQTLAFWRSFLAEPISKLNKRLPPWYAGGFGHPDYVADFDYWCKMPTLDIEETLCLSIGIEPRHFGKQDIAHLKKQEFDRLWSPLQFLLQRHEQLRRQFDPFNHGDRITPTKFLSWAKRVEFHAHPEFVGLLERYDPMNANQPANQAPEQRTDPREVATMAQLFTAMAIDMYGYDPKQSRSPVTKEIAELAASMGMSVSDDTVRKYLRIGSKYLPKDWKPYKD